MSVCKSFLSRGNSQFDIILPSLFKTFFDISKVPKHDQAIKKVGVSVSVCVIVGASVLLTVRMIFQPTKRLQSSYWCQNFHNFDAVN
jgi:mannose/fructose/N-acetylgalactosamine-specific phosphotransferase system component IIC